VRLVKGDPAGAATAYQEAYTAATDAGVPDQARRWASNAATAYIHLSQWQDAQRWNEIARGPGSPGGETRPEVFSDANAAGILSARDLPGAIAAYRQVLAHASGYTELEWAVHTRLALLYAEQKDSTNARHEFEAALSLIETKRSGLSSAAFKITFLAALMDSYQKYVAELVREGDERKAFEVAERSRARMLLERLGKAAANGESALSVNPESVARAAGVVILSYWIAPRESYLWVVTANGVHLVRLPAESEIEKLATAYRHAIIQSTEDPLRNAAGQQLYRIVIEPASQYIPKNSAVIVAPDGPLHQINLETLPVPGDPPHYWIEDVTLSVTPSFSALERRGPDRKDVVRSLLIVGAPDVADPRYPKLAGAQKEIESIRNRLRAVPARVYEGATATPAAFFDSKPAQFSLIHFAAHGEANRQSPLDSSVVLSPGPRGFKLYARDIIGVPIRAELVTISACRSAEARSYSGEGPIGLAWAFLTAGANSVVAGLWDVGDEATATLMDGMYAGIANGSSPAEALRQAKREMIQSGTKFRKPYYWAPFQDYAVRLSFGHR
jgi:CHAT domain-containing protein